MERIGVDWALQRDPHYFLLDPQILAGPGPGETGVGMEHCWEVETWEGKDIVF